jgi:hypothetical protein
VRLVWTPRHWVSFARTTAASASRTESRAEAAGGGGGDEAGGAATSAVHRVVSAWGPSRPGRGEAEEGRQTRLLGGAGRVGEAERGRLRSRRSRGVQAWGEGREPREGERERVGPAAPFRYGERKPLMTEGVGVLLHPRRRRWGGGSGEHRGERLRGGRRRSRRSESRRG